MIKLITTDNDRTYQTRSFAVNAGAAAAGGLTYITAKELGPNYLCRPLLKNMTKHGKAIEPDVIKNALTEVLKTPQVSSKNFKIIDMDKLPKIEPPFLNVFLNETRKNKRNLSGFSEEILKQEKFVNSICRSSVPWYSKPFKPLKEHYTNLIRYTFQEGKNACCLPVLRKIIVNMQKLGGSVFHEIGHGMNPKLNVAAVLTGESVKYIAAIAVLKRSKLKGEECKDNFDKALTFIKKHAPLLGMAAMLPIVGTEFLASYKGAKMVKPFVDKNTFKKIKALQFAGGASYVALTLLTGGAIYAGSKVRDIVAKPKRVIPNSRGEINERKRKNDTGRTV